MLLCGFLCSTQKIREEINMVKIIAYVLLLIGCIGLLGILTFLMAVEVYRERSKFRSPTKDEWKIM